MYRLYLTYVIIICSYTYVNCANILGVSVFPSISHRVVFEPIWRELSLKGHNVTVVTPHPLNDPTLTNLTEINVNAAYDVIEAKELEDIVSKDRSLHTSIFNMVNLLDMIIESELNSTQFQNLLNSHSKFDLMLIECIHPSIYALASSFNAPMICMSACGATFLIHNAVGNPSHPVLYSDIALTKSSLSLTLWQKTKNVLINILLRFYYYQVFLPQSDKLARKYFGNQIPYIGDIERNISMLFLNVNPLVYSPRPNVPTVIEMGQMHIKPVKPLPEDLKQFLDEGKNGVIYFSLGSTLKSVNMKENLRNTVIGALSELPYKVLWKWESDQIPGKPDNVIISKWFPQQDILAHPNVKVFVTHGGLLSIEEAVTRTVPLIAMPFCCDLPFNVRNFEKLEIGVILNPTTVTKDELKNALIEVIENVKYKKKIIEARDILYDKPTTGLEKAVWWSEYVIRHKGTRHLRSQTADISWFEFLLLDVLLVIVLAMVVFIYLLYKLMQLTLRIKKRNKLKSC